MTPRKKHAASKSAAPSSGRLEEGAAAGPTHGDWLVDEALQETFPASDAIAPAGDAQGTSRRRNDPVGLPAHRAARLPASQEVPARQLADVDVRLKRAYADPAPEDGLRILVDRLWPRGVRKADAAIELWEKDLAPSTELRQWFGHEPQRWSEFRRRYALELQRHAARLEELRDMAHRQRLTLVYAARDQEHNEAVVLQDVLLGRHATSNGRSAP